MDEVAQYPILVTRAELHETEAVSAVMQEVARWLIAGDQPLWDSEDLSTEKLRPFAARGALYIARRNGEPVGAFMMETEDSLWRDIPANESLFIHKLSVRRQVAGQGVGLVMLRWAECAAKEANKRYVRLDCVARPRLRAFYERTGFTCRDVVPVGTQMVARYERDLRE